LKKAFLGQKCAREKPEQNNRNIYETLMVAQNKANPAVLRQLSLYFYLYAEQLEHNIKKRFYHSRKPLLFPGNHTIHKPRRNNRNESHAYGKIK